MTGINVNEGEKELYEGIVTDIKGMYNEELTEVEAHTATRNFIEFVKILMKHHEKDN